MITSKILEAKKILEQYAPEGEFLAYINKEEAEVLKSLGASGTPVEETGVPSFELPDYLKDTAKDYARQMTATYGAPINTASFMGPGYIAGMDPAQQQAYGLATQGVGSYQPYLQAAQAAQAQGAGHLGAAAGAFGGLGAYQTAAGNIASGAAGMTGPDAYKSFMSPYQTQVIDATLSEFDKQRAAGQQTIKDAAVGSGAFGGGREGAQLGQYQANSLADRAALQSSMLQSGFQNAQQAAQQNFQNQGNLYNMQRGLYDQQRGIGMSQQNLAQGYQNQMRDIYGLSDFGRRGLGGDIQALGAVGSMRQGQEQARLNALQQQRQAQAYEPYGRLNQYGAGLTGLAGGMAAPQYQAPGQSNPWQTAMSTMTGLGGLYSQIFGRRSS